MQLQDFIKDNTNILEIYFCPEKIDPNASIFTCKWKDLPKLPLHMFKHRNDQELIEYAHRGLVYQYDVATDSQKTIQRSWIHDKIIDKQYIVSLQEETLPVHRFPCTQEINDKTKFHRISYKWTNRIYLIVDMEEDYYTVYIRYQHVDNIDLEKMNEDLNQLLKLT